MREIRLSGSEGGGFELNRFSLPLSLERPFGAKEPSARPKTLACGERTLP